VRKLLGQTALAALFAALGACSPSALNQAEPKRDAGNGDGLDGGEPPDGIAPDASADADPDPVFTPD
jgi:hypothetical protein